MIKMVCSDLDGTLLQYGKKLIEGEIFDEIRALHDRGILFCPASGRQYTSLRKLFAPVADDCIYLCENGAVVYRGGKVIAKTPMPRAGRRNRLGFLEQHRGLRRSDAFR